MPKPLTTAKKQRKNRSKQQEKIENYLKQNPNETNKSKIARELNIDRRTVYKYFQNKD